MLIALLAATAMLTPLAYLAGRQTGSPFSGSLTVSSPTAVQPIPAIGALPVASFPPPSKHTTTSSGGGVTTTPASPGTTTTSTPPPTFHPTPTTTHRQTPPPPHTNTVPGITVGPTP
jgi:hypothetical protein